MLRAPYNRWMRRMGVVMAMIVASAMFHGPASAGYSFPGNARYSVPKAKMDDALACARGDRVSRGTKVLNGRGRKHPVLLVHGTGADRDGNWSWNYWPLLRDRGWEVCWVNLPHASLRDMQIQAEYVARAVQVMHRATGERIDVMGHSQGGLHPRWAIKWFPAGRFVADYIGLASPNHGTQVAESSSEATGCFPSCWQLRRDSRYIAALNRDNETPGPRIAYTSIYTTFDELVQPVGTQILKGGASNILLQDLCPGRPVDHVAIARDHVTWLLVRDALLTKGPADAGVVQPEDCAQSTMPGSGEPGAGFGTFEDYINDKNRTDREPPLKPYARAG